MTKSCYWWVPYQLTSNSFLKCKLSKLGSTWLTIKAFVLISIRAQIHGELGWLMGLNSLWNL